MNVLKSTKALAGAAVITLATMGAASAATVTFDMGDVTQGGATDMISNGGIDLTITAAGGSEGLLSLFSNNALGVGDGATGPGTDAGDLMSAGESLQFDFTPTVNLINTLIFESRGGTDTVQITNLSSGDMVQYVVTDQGSGNSGPKIDTIDFAIDLPSFDAIGNSFLFEVLGGTGGNQGVAIQSIDVAAVPLPAGMALLLTGLGGLALTRRRTSA